MLKAILLLMPFLLAGFQMSQAWENHVPEIGKKVESITRNGKKSPIVSYAYSKYGLDFVKTIEAESKWNPKAIGDGGNSYWLCQFHRLWNEPLQKAYRSAKTDFDRVDICHDYYQAIMDKWTIRKRLYWYRYRNLPQNSDPFKVIWE